MVQRVVDAANPGAQLGAQRVAECLHRDAVEDLLRVAEDVRVHALPRHLRAPDQGPDAVDLGQVAVQIVGVGLTLGDLLGQALQLAPDSTADCHSLMR